MKLLRDCKQKHLELVKTKHIEKALYFGANTCGQKIAANIRPLQREIHLIKKDLRSDISHINGEKQAMRGIQ